MERNWDLIREILRILAEKSPDDYGKSLGYDYFVQELSDYHENIVKYHLKMMIETEFINGRNVSTIAGENYLIKEMTYQGQDLWEAIKEKSFWEKITQYATKNKIPLTLDTIKMIIPMLLKTMFS